MSLADFITQGLLAIYGSVQNVQTWLYVVTGLAAAGCVASVVNLIVTLGRKPCSK